jgi:methylphosphotriester-DNA--protein-cysteine methyltransferase
MSPDSLTPAIRPERLGERVLARTCGQCGAAFQAVRPHQRFCRPSCRVEHFKARLPLLDTAADALRLEGKSE